jgi:hypothetical protein
LGRIEPKRIVVQIPRINKFESVWKPIFVSKAQCERIGTKLNSECGSLPLACPLPHIFWRLLIRTRRQIRGLSD